MSSSFTIRTLEACDRDYEIIARLDAAVYPESPATLGEVRRYYECAPDWHTHRLFIAERGGEPVGHSFAGHRPFAARPDKIWITAVVLPQCRGLGIGSALYHEAAASIAGLDPAALRAHVKEDHVDGLRFAQRRGFQELMREWDSELDLTYYDPAKFESRAGKARDSGIEIKTLAQLEAEGFPDLPRALHAAESAILPDIPAVESPDPLPFEQWEKIVLSSPNFLPEGFFIALDQYQIVGVSALWRRAADDRLETGLTGVLSSHRRRGIAMALKLSALKFAKERGAPAVRTNNATTNRPMLSINEMLGFEKEPATILMMKRMRDNNPNV